MLIGFIGSHGTGKTTTAEELSAITRIPMLGSTARVASDAGLPVNQEATMLSQLLVTVSRANQVLDGPRDSQDRPHAITDRTPLDSYAYTTYQCDYQWQNESFDQVNWYMQQSRDLVSAAMKKYTHLFYFPVLWEPENDGLRKTDPDYQRAIDDRLVVLMREFGIKAATMPDATALERAHMIKTVISASVMV